jgi:hypothetical protein
LLPSRLENQNWISNYRGSSGSHRFVSPVGGGDADASSTFAFVFDRLSAFQTEKLYWATFIRLMAHFYAHFTYVISLLQAFAVMRTFPQLIIDQPTQTGNRDHPMRVEPMAIEV